MQIKDLNYYLFCFVGVLFLSDEVIFVTKY